MTSEEARFVEALTSAQKPILDRLDRLDKRVETLTGQRTLGFITAAIGLLVGIVAVAYAINREAALKEQITINRGATCAQAKVTALAPRKSQLAGESLNHYLNRLQAQREQLLAASGLKCPSLPGFATFPFLRAQALDEIDRILLQRAPKKLRESLGISNRREHGEGSFTSNLPSSPTPAGHGGIEPGSSEGHGGSPGGSGQPSSPPKSSSPPSHGGKGGNGGNGNGAGNPSAGTETPPPSGPATVPPKEGSPPAEANPPPEETTNPPPTPSAAEKILELPCHIEVLGKPLVCLP
jgi:hypothetical protein